MAANSRFSVAIHILTALAYRPDASGTSADLARSIRTNPVVVRRLLSQLHHSGLITCQPGKSGGCHLAKRPEQITLYDVFKEVEVGGPFNIPDKPENKSCEVSCHMKEILTGIFEQTQAAIANSLKKTSLADLVKTVTTAAA